MQDDRGEPRIDGYETPASELQERIRLPALPYPVTTEDVLGESPADTALFVP